MTEAISDLNYVVMQDIGFKASAVPNKIVNGSVVVTKDNKEVLRQHFSDVDGLARALTAIKEVTPSNQFSAGITKLFDMALENSTPLAIGATFGAVAATAAYKLSR